MTLKVKPGTTDAVEFKGWSSKKTVVLKDDSKTAYDLLDVTSKGKEDATSIGPGKQMQVQLIFKPLAKKVKYLRLELPTSPFGGKRTLKIRSPRNPSGERGEA